MPKISVIIPSYNHARYIEEAIYSVLNQSFSDLELIIIDDASQDHSWRVIQRFKDPRITAIQHTENQGADQTINQGLALAKGDYLTILNSDDSYHPERLEQLIKLKRDFIATDLNLCDEHSQNKEARETDWVNWFENLKQDYAKTEDFLATLLKGNFLITTSNFFFSKQLYQQLKGFKGLRYVHDYEFAIRALFTDFKVEYYPKKLLNYRLHDSNTIREAPLKAIQENVNLLLSLAKDFADKFATKPHYLISLAQHLKELYQYTNIEWETQNHHKLVNKEQELFALINDRDKWIKERNSWIHERDGQINERNQWLNDRDKHIEKLDNKIQEYILTFNTLNNELETQKIWISDRDRWIKERDNIIEKQKTWIKDRDQWIKERNQTIQELNKEIEALRNSRSYRLGQYLFSPARPLKKIIKGEKYA